jgi:hypothetical protein
MLTNHVPLNIAVIPLPVGSYFTLVRVIPCFASLAVPRRSVPIFMCCVYLLKISSCGHVTSCSRARSMSCRFRKSCNIFRRVCCVIPFIFRVATLYTYIIYSMGSLGGILVLRDLLRVR